MRTELHGSPAEVVVQVPGVVAAVNCSSQVCEASSGIVYESEFGQYANKDPSFVHGQYIILNTSSITL